MPCYNAYQQNLAQNQALNFAMLDYLQEEMAYMAGLRASAPRLRVPQPTYKGGAVNMNTTNNIHVEAGSQIGQINAGALIYLDRCVTALTNAGATNVAAELKEFTQLVVDNQELSAESQKQVLDLLRALMEELIKSKEKRNGSMVQLVLKTIGPLVSVANATASHWDKLKPMLEHLFGH